MREETNCRHYETPWFHNFKANQKPNKTRQNSDDTQIFRPDLRFASRKNSKTTQKKGPNPQPKTPKKPQNFPWTRRKNPTCHEKCTKKQISLSTAQKRVKSCATMKSSNKLAKFHCQAVHYGSHLRILSDVLFQSSRRLIIFESSCSRQKRLSLHSAEGYRNLQTSHSSVVRPKREQDCGPRQISCRYKTATLCSLDWPTNYSLLRLLGRPLFARLFFVTL